MNPVSNYSVLTGKDVVVVHLVALSLTLFVTFFSLLVMLVILTNCFFMAFNKEVPYAE